MGTRADFYIGRGESAEWIGSIAWDGYPEGIADNVLIATTRKEFELELKKFFSFRRDVTLPADGWPWPWNDSRTTDWAYAFDAGQVYMSKFGREWVQVKSESELPEEYYESGKTSVFPDMTKIQNVRLDHGSGLIILTSHGAKQ